MSKELINLSLELSNINGISSREEEVAKYVKSKMSKHKGLKFERDNLGSLAIIKNGKTAKSPSIMFMAHMDEVGFLVTKIEKNGLIKFTPVGGWWGHVVLGQRLTIITNEGKELVGVVGSIPPHILTSEVQSKVMSIDKMFIDVGCSTDKQVRDFGVKPGNMVVPTSKSFMGLDGDSLIGKALDDRVAVAVGMEVMNRLQKIDHEAKVVFICSTQEEVGLRGARTSSFKWTTDVAFAVDVTIANDMPGMEDKDTKLRTGVALSLFDRSVMGNVKLIDKVESIAKKYKIPHTFDGLAQGGTDAGAIHLTKEGIITMTLSIPSRYIHSHNSMVSIKDMEATIDLLVNFIKDFKSKDLQELQYE